jgi:hypothetical protein
VNRSEPGVGDTDLDLTIDCDFSSNHWMVMASNNKKCKTFRIKPKIKTERKGKLKRNLIKS